MIARAGGVPADGMQVVVAGGCDYYAGSATSSPGFSFAVLDLRLAGEGDLLARIERLRRQLRAEGLLETQQRLARPLLPRSIGVITGEGGKARDDVLAALARRGWAGRLVWGFAPVQDRHAAPAIVRALGDLAAVARGRGRDRGARRRLAGRPAVLLRRDAVPHRRPARRAGDRVRRPSHRPHAARRRRRGELLDTHPCRRGGRRRGLPARARRAGRGWLRGCATTAAERCSRAPARSPRCRARPRRTSIASGLACTSRSARSAPARAGGSSSSAASAAATPWCSRARPTPRCATAARSARGSSSACSSRSPATTRSERSSAATCSCTPLTARPLLSARSARAAAGEEIALRFADGVLGARILEP